MKNIYYIIALAFLTLGLIIFSTTADAGGPWDNQYCDVEVTKIKIVNEEGDVIENLTEEKVVCNDGASDFLFGRSHNNSKTDYVQKNGWDRI